MQNILMTFYCQERHTIGVTVSSLKAVPYGQMYYRKLEKCKVQSLARSGGNFDRKAYSEEAENELKW